MLMWEPQRQQLQRRRTLPRASEAGEGRAGGRRDGDTACSWGVPHGIRVVCCACSPTGEQFLAGGFVGRQGQQGRMWANPQRCGGEKEGL